MLEVVDLRPFSPDDAGAVRSHVEVTNAVRCADSPWLPPLTEHEAVGMLTYGWDLEPRVAFLALDGDDVVGVASFSISERDNLHLAWLGVEVHPTYRRCGHGAAMLDQLIERVRSLGRTSIGIDGWESEQVRAFAARHGLDQKAVGVNRRQLLADLDWAELDRSYAAAAAHASPYELVRRQGPTPADELEAMAVMVAAINDAPTDDLDIEDEVFDADRVRAYETAHEQRGIALHRVVARHKETGELAGHTVVGVDLERPELGEQHDTSVLGSHRGHRLGLLLKLEMLRWLRDEQPQLESIDTWNAESNDHMIGVNAAMGYQIMGRALEYQRSV